MQLTHMRDLLVEAPLPSGHAFLSAASGMVVRGSLLCVVADDAQCLALFDLDGAEPGRLIPLIADDLPECATARRSSARCSAARCKGVPPARARFRVDTTADARRGG